MKKVVCPSIEVVTQDPDIAPFTPSDFQRPGAVCGSPAFSQKIPQEQGQGHLACNLVYQFSEMNATFFTPVSCNTEVDEDVTVRNNLQLLLDEAHVVKKFEDEQSLHLKLLFSTIEKALEFSRLLYSWNIGDGGFDQDKGVTWWEPRSVMLVRDGQAIVELDLQNKKRHERDQNELTVLERRGVNTERLLSPAQSVLETPAPKPSRACMIL